MPKRADAHLHFFAPSYAARLPESCRRVQPDAALDRSEGPTRWWRDSPAGGSCSGRPRRHRSRSLVARQPPDGVCSRGGALLPRMWHTMSLAAVASTPWIQLIQP